MAREKTYATSDETKKRIMEACKRLFCERGYRQTTYVDICRQANVHPGTITYHFGSKKNIATTLYQELMKEYNTWVEAAFSQEDELQQILIANGLHLKLLFTDTVFRRFSSEYSSEDLHRDPLQQYADIADKAYRFTQNYVGEKKARFLFVVFKGMDAYLEPYIDENLNELTLREVFTFISEIYYPYIDRKELSSRVTRALELIDSIDISFDQFSLTAVRRQPSPPRISYA